MKMLKILKFFFDRFKWCQNTSLIYRESEDNQVLKPQSSCVIFRKLVEELQKNQRFKNIDAKVLTV